MQNKRDMGHAPVPVAYLTLNKPHSLIIFGGCGVRELGGVDSGLIRG